MCVRGSTCTAYEVTNRSYVGAPRDPPRKPHTYAAHERGRSPIEAEKTIAFPWPRGPDHTAVSPPPERPETRVPGAGAPAWPRRGVARSEDTARVYSTICIIAPFRLNSHSFAKDSRCARLGGLGLLARTRLTTRLTGRVLITGECAPCSYSNGPRQLTRRHPDPHQPLISRRRARGRCSSTQYRDSRSPKRQRARYSPPNRTWAALAPARAVSAELATVDCCC